MTKSLDALIAARDALIKTGDDIHDILTTPYNRTQLAEAIDTYLTERTDAAMKAVIACEQKGSP